MRWNLHSLIEPVAGVLLDAHYLSKMSAWRKRTRVKGYNDWYRSNWDYSRRYELYENVISQENLKDAELDYFEFGVCGGHSFKWWLEHNHHSGSRFFGFDTFEGLPESFGPFQKGSMAVAMESLQITDQRSRFYKGLFQDTLVPFLGNYDGSRRKLIHMDADLFSATLFSLSQLYRFLREGDIIIFDEFAVPRHEFRAFKIFTESFYLKYEVIAAANNYLFLAIRIMKN